MFSSFARMLNVRISTVVVGCVGKGEMLYVDVLTFLLYIPLFIVVVMPKTYVLTYVRSVHV